jgi:hypothetical protein
MKLMEFITNFFAEMWVLLMETLPAPWISVCRHPEGLFPAQDH